MPDATPVNIPEQVRLNELRPKLIELAKKSGVRKPEIIRQAVDEFMQRNDTPEKVAKSAIQYRLTKAAQITS